MSFILIFTVLAEIITLLPQNVQAEESEFVIQNGVLVKYNGSDKDISILGIVTSIKRNAFAKCSGLQSVTIPGSVKKIGDCGFDSCPDLKKMVLKNGVSTIAENAFGGCK